MAYYDGQMEEDISDIDEDVEAEEKEVLELQKEKAKLLRVEDFDVAGVGGGVGEDDDEDAEACGQDDEKRRKGGKKKIGSKSDMALLSAMNRDLDDIALDLGGDLRRHDGDNVEVVSLGKKRDGLTKEKALQFLMDESPELMELLADLKKHAESIEDKDNYVELAQFFAEHGLVTKNAAQCLRNELFLSLNYMLSICFYLLLKANGQNALTSHPVISDIVSLRAALTKTTPVANVLCDVIDGCRAQVSSKGAFDDMLMDGDDDDDVEDMDLESARKGQDKKKKKKKKQKQKQKTSKKDKKKRRYHSEDGDGDDDDVEDDEGDMEEEPAKKKTKNVHVEYGEDEDAAEIERLVQLEATQSGRQTLLKKKQLVVGDDDATGREGDTKQLSKSIKKMSQSMSKANRRLGASADEDVKFQERKLLPNVTEQAPVDEHFGGGADDADDSGDDDIDRLAAAETNLTAKANALLARLSASKTDKAAAKARRKEAKRQMLIAQFNQEDADKTAAAAGAKHAATEVMLKNKGLTRMRGTKGRKKAMISRQKHRHKYSTAVKKRNALVKQYTGASTTYAGESTGIKSNLTRSRKLSS